MSVLLLGLPFGHVAEPHGRRLLCHRTRKAFLHGGTSCLTPRMRALKAPYLSRRADCDRVVTNAVGPLWCRLRRLLKMLLHFLVHRAIEWVIFNRFRSAAAVVVAVRMWATRLRSPSCARRGYARSCVDLVGRGGAGLLTAVGRWIDVPRL